MRQKWPMTSTMWEVLAKRQAGIQALLSPATCILSTGENYLACIIMKFVCWCPLEGHQHDVYEYLGQSFLRISCLKKKKIAQTLVLVRVWTCLLPFIFQILGLTFWMVLIFNLYSLTMKTSNGLTHSISVLVQQLVCV